MTNKIRNSAFKLIFSLSLLVVVAAACNNSADEKKEPAKDTAMKPMDTAAATMPIIDTTKMDSAAKQKPTAPADKTGAQ